MTMSLISNNYSLLCRTNVSGCFFALRLVLEKQNLMHMIYNLLYYDKVYLYAKNLEQSKYRDMIDMFQPISKEAGYDVIEASNDQIIPVSDLTDDNQKLVIFDDFVCEKNQKPLVDYFIRGRHKNCSVIYLSIVLQNSEGYQTQLFTLLHL